jgi:hypothetical protein
MKRRIHIFVLLVLLLAALPELALAAAPSPVAIDVCAAQSHDIPYPTAAIEAGNANCLDDYPLPYPAADSEGDGISYFGRSTAINSSAKIESAMSPAPIAIAKDATVLDYPAEAGQPFVELRHGTNGWTCYPDRPDSPGNDPQCLDETWQRWLEALMNGSLPYVTSVGFAYKLQGGSDASSATPYMLEPRQGEEWVATPPQVMLLVPGGLDTTRFSVEPGSDQPYIMWAGTAFEYLAIPVPDESVVNLMAFPFEDMNPHKLVADIPTATAELMEFLFEGLNPHEPVADTTSADVELMAFPFEGLNPRGPTADTTSADVELMAFPFEGLNPHRPVADTTTASVELVALPLEDLSPRGPVVDTPAANVELMAFPFEGLNPR